jgi:hypothetical protein
MNPSEQFKNITDKIKIYSFTYDRVVEFTSFLTEFKDQRTSNWSSQEIYGRMDPIFTYKNTTRKITLSFDVPSYNMDDAIKNSEKLSSLKETIYPFYMQREKERNYVLSTPPFHRIRFANLIKSETDNLQSSKINNGLLGWIDGLTFKPELDSGFFEKDGSLYAKLFKLNFTFNVIHEHPLGFDKNHKKRG